MAKILEIRNSTAEFLTFLAENREDGVQVVYKDENIWATQAAMAELFDCTADNIGVHLKNIYAEGELRESATTEKISVVQIEGKRNVSREPTFYIQNAGHITAEFAKQYAETEFEKYRVIQDHLFTSDFDKLSEEATLPELPFDSEKI